MTEVASRQIAATTLVEGRAEAPVLALLEPLSFWGGLDALSGRIIDRRHPQLGSSVSNLILVMRSARGSSSGTSVLAEAIRLGTGPAGIVLLSRDAIVTVGAMIALELYRKQCPVVLVELTHWSRLSEASQLSIAAEKDGGTITC